jgi:homocitrate synthase
MCPTADEIGTNGVRHTNGTNGSNGANGGHPGYTGINTSSTPRNAKNPYLPPQDFISNVSRFKIIESTLREGEQ